MKKLLIIALIVIGSAFAEFEISTCNFHNGTTYWEDQFGTKSCGTYKKYMPKTICNRPISSKVDQAISHLYKEGVRLTEGLISDEISFTMDVDGYIYVTLVQADAGYKNALGVYKKGGSSEHGLELIDVFQFVNSHSNSCLKKGDTAIIGPLQKNVQYGIFLHPNARGDSPKTRLYSDVHFKYPDMVASDGVGHITMIYVQESGDTVFGFEDAIGGDYDYNDVMFTINTDGEANFTNRPIYNNGSIEKCLPVESVTSTSYAENQCYSWALLEKSEESSCNFYLKPPPGWIVAPLDQITRDAITSIGDKWNYECIGVVDNGNIVGVKKSDPTQTCELSTFSEVIVDGCYGIKCEHRILLRREAQLQSCGQGYDFCSETARRISAYPSADNNWNIFPNSINSFLSKRSDSDYSDTLKVRNLFNEDKLQVDVVVAVELEGLSNDDVKMIKSQYENVFSGLDSFDFRVAIAGYSEGVVSVGLFRTTHVSSEVDTIIKSKSGSASKLSVDMIKKVSSYNYGWRQDHALKVIYVVTGKDIPTISDAEVKAVLDQNNLVIFGSTQSDDSKWTTFANKFLNSAGRKISKSGNNNRFRNYVSKLNDDIQTVSKKSALHVVSGGSYITLLEPTKSMTTEITQNFNIKYDTSLPTPNPSVPAVVLNALGRSQLKVFIHTNRAPIATDVRVSIPSGETEMEFTLQGSDADFGKLNFTLQALDLDEGLSLEFRDLSNNVLPLDSEFTSSDQKLKVVILSGSQGLSTFKYIVDDGCETATAEVVISINCDNAETCRVPTCSSATYSVPKRNIVSFALSGYYTDADGLDPYANITKEVIKIEGPADVDYFFTNKNGDELTSPLVNGFSSQDVIVHYRSDSQFGNNLHTLTYRVSNANQEEGIDIQYTTCTVTLSVTKANDPPVYSGEDIVVTFEDETLLFRIDEQSVKYEDESIQMPNRLGVELDVSTITKGSIQCCFGEDCSLANCELMDNGLPTFQYTPRPNDYGEGDNYDYITIPFVFFDKSQDVPNMNPHSFKVRVIPVNDAPVIVVDGDVKTLDVTKEPNVINKGEEFVFSWIVQDIDNLPKDLKTIVTANPLTRSPWSAYSCVNGEADCSKELDLKPIEIIVPNEVEIINCEDEQKLKNQLGEGLENCYARYTVRFVPVNSQVPYIQFTIQGTDSQSANSLTEAKHLLVNVLPINLPPVVWSPPEIESTSNLVNIKVGNNTVNASDDSPPLWTVQLTMKSISENGNFVIPTVASSKCVVSDDTHTVVCSDTIGSINNWIQELRFNITDGNSSANISFVVNDNGLPGDLRPLDSNIAYTSIKISQSIVPDVPKSSSKLLIIALSVGAAGAIAVGLLVALLRNKISPPADDYFQIGTETVSSSPTSPLYQAQTKESFSTLYSGSKV